MNDPVIDTSSGDKAVTTAANPLGQGQRMHQRHEWEQAFLSAQQQQYTPAPSPRSDDQVNVTVDAKAAALVSTGVAGQPRLAAATSLPTGDVATTASAVKTVAAAEFTTAEKALQPEIAARGEAQSRVLARTQAVAPRAPITPAPVRSQAAQPEPVAVRAHRVDDGVHLTIRDATLSSVTAESLVARVRSMLQRVGLRLTSLTLNGSRVVDALPQTRSGTAGDRARDHDLDLTL